MRVIVFMAILVRFGDAGNPFKKIFGKIGRGFDSMICRAKHHKVVLDSSNQFERCERKCPSNYKEKYSVHWGHHCKPVDIPHGCIDESCIRCFPGYNWMFVLNKGPKCVAECPKGFWKTAINTCMQCTLDNCEECTGQRTCTKCKADMALYKTFMKSVICVNSCPLSNKEFTNQDGLKVCEKNDVTTSQAPATVTESSTKNDSHIGCVDDNCVSCKIGYFKYYRPEGGSECLEKCPIGHSTVGTLCAACSDKRCASCNSSLAECDKCFPGYSMLLDSFNITTKCVRDCPKKHEKKVIDGTSICIIQKQQECPVANCKKCLRSSLHVFHGGCEECSEGFILFRGSFCDYCYTSCPEGYYETRKDGKGNMICNKCLAPFCSKCESKNSTCLKCMEPMILDQVLQRCTTCPVLTDYDFRTKRCVRLGEIKTTPMGNFIY